MSTKHTQSDEESIAPKNTGEAISAEKYMMENQHAPKHKGLHKAIAITALLVGFIALAGSIFVWYSTAVTGRLELNEALTRTEVIAKEFDSFRLSQRTVVAEQTALRREFEHDLRTLKERLKVLDEEIGTEFVRLNKQQNDTERELKAELDILVRSMESTRQEMGRGSGDWLLAEISQLLILANERLLLTGDVPLAIRALELAQERMAELADPALLAVRRQLAADIAMLTAIPLPDVNRVVLQLSILIQQVSDLPLTGDAMVSELVPPLAEKIIEDANADNTWSGLGRRLIEDLSALVRIRNIDTTQMPHLAPDQRFLVYESVRSPLNAAQLALLRGLPVVYRLSLGQALAALTSGFDERSIKVITFSSDVERLTAIEVVVEYPDISKAHRMLQKIDQQRSEAE